MTLFRLDASIAPQNSASAELADIVQEHWLLAHPSDDVHVRQIGTDPVPSQAWAYAVTAGSIDPADWTPAQRDAAALSAELVDELVTAEAALLAVPLYNFGVSQHVKAWMDLIIANPASQGADTQLLAGKPVVLTTVRGGAYGPGTPRHGWDHSTDYLVRILADVWGADLTVVERDFTLVGVNPALDSFTDVARSMRSSALQAAADAGRSLTGATAH